MENEDRDVVARETENGNIEIKTPSGETSHTFAAGGNDEPDRTYLTREVAEQVRDELDRVLDEGGDRG